MCRSSQGGRVVVGQSWGEVVRGQSSCGAELGRLGSVPGVFSVVPPGSHPTTSIERAQSCTRTPRINTFRRFLKQEGTYIFSIFQSCELSVDSVFSYQHNETRHKQTNAVNKRISYSSTKKIFNLTFVFYILNQELFL